MQSSSETSPSWWTTLLHRTPLHLVGLGLFFCYLIVACVLNFHDALPLLYVVGTYAAYRLLRFCVTWGFLLRLKYQGKIGGSADLIVSDMETQEQLMADAGLARTSVRASRDELYSGDQQAKRLSHSGEIRSLLSPTLTQPSPAFPFSSKPVRIAVSVVLVVSFVIFAIYVLAENWLRAVSAAGLCGFILIAYAGSHNRAMINWGTVAWGFLLQFIFALLILKTDPGYQFFETVGDVVSDLLESSDAGAEMVFGEDFRDHYFAFKVLPSIVFFSALVSVLHHFGWIQSVIRSIAHVMMISMKTSGAESLVCAGNIFIGQTESPMLVKPYLLSMTKSELHVVMTSGFATIAGGVMASYISFGISASHLIAASVMSAPAALAISKIMYPETEVAKTASMDTLHEWDMKSTHMNFIDAAVAGTTAGLGLAANVGAVMLAFRSLLELCNMILGYFGSLVDIKDLTFELITGYLFVPLAMMMGVTPRDVLLVGKLLGKKTILTEFMAFLDLQELIENYDLVQAGLADEDSVDYISERSQTIAIYALCGFSNVISIGVQIGGIESVCPERRQDAVDVVIRALVAGSLACFMTATVVGMLT